MIARRAPGDAALMDGVEPYDDPADGMPFRFVRNVRALLAEQVGIPAEELHLRVLERMEADAEERGRDGAARRRVRGRSRRWRSSSRRASDGRSPPRAGW